MSRTGPAFVESEDELYEDIERKRENGDISASTADNFIELYEFAIDLGDDVTIGGAKHANFQLKVDAHQGDYSGDPSVFTANVDKELQIWPARMVLDNDPDMDSVEWDAQDYHDFETAFGSLSGVTRGSTAADFDSTSSNLDLDQFESIVRHFVSTCRQKSSGGT